jgi:4-amino-4-deoxy-L-arabinose transferase-like glycosyltransferase
VYVVGRRFLGEAAACLATTACALDPNLIANGAVATVDMIYALATLLTLGRRALDGEKPSVGAGRRSGPRSAWPSPRSSRPSSSCPRCSCSRC